MPVVPILKAPNRKLLQRSVPALDLGKDTQAIIRDLIDTLDNAKNPEGAGLSAPQLGILQRICVVKKPLRRKSGEAPAYKNLILVNPVVTHTSNETQLDWEGCLSIDDTYGQVQRPKKVRLTSFNEKGRAIKVDAAGFLARVIQHEMDHLNGILFTSKVVGKTYTEKELDELFHTRNNANIQV